MRTVGEFFNAAYGDKRYESKAWLLKQPGATPLVASGGRNNGIYGLFSIPATKENVISVARTGSVGAAFFHGYPCEISCDAIVLTPKKKTSPELMSWFALAIGMNRKRFNYGRKVTPERVKELTIPNPPRKLHGLRNLVTALKTEMDLLEWPKGRSSGALKRPKTVTDLFEMQYGNSYELYKLALDDGGINFVSRRMGNNGVSARVARTEDEPFPAGDLTVALSGNGVLETCVQPAPFYTAFHVAVLKAKKPLSLEEKLFCCFAIRLNRFRYGFGRQANRTLGDIVIPAAPKWLGKVKLSGLCDKVATEIGQFAAEHIAKQAK
jgi:hypothetical protein